MQILIATRNQGKLREIGKLLEGMPYDVTSPNDIPGLPDVLEDGLTFEENAKKKAAALAAASGLLTLADDSGLMVDALGGAPGVFSARYAGEPVNDKANCRKILDNLDGVPQDKRTARFVCVIAGAAPDRLLFTVRGECEGVIINEPRGENGFGYDPVFFFSPKGRTFAQLHMDEKNIVSHRAKALSLAKVELEKLT
ncbi:MAG: XTP/dITP diphosphatase [Planctomycetota bacterium]|jgi:XTP/dITP diphosphohydrolase